MKIILIRYFFSFNKFCSKFKFNKYHEILKASKSSFHFQIIPQAISLSLLTCKPLIGDVAPPKISHSELTSEGKIKTFLSMNQTFNQSGSRLVRSRKKIIFSQAVKLEIRECENISETGRKEKQFTEEFIQRQIKSKFAPCGIW